MVSPEDFGFCVAVAVSVPASAAWKVTGGGGEDALEGDRPCSEGRCVISGSKNFWIFSGALVAGSAFVFVKRHIFFLCLQLSVMQDEA